MPDHFGKMTRDELQACLDDLRGLGVIAKEIAAPLPLNPADTARATCLRNTPSAHPAGNPGMFEAHDGPVYQEPEPSTLRLATLATLRDLAHELNVSGKFEQEQAVREAMGWGTKG